MEGASAHGRLKRLSGLVALLALALFAGCAKKMVVTGVPVYEEHWLATVDSLGPRASDDLGCPSDQLDWSLYARRGRLPFEVGVQGCGNRLVYLGSYLNGWMIRPGDPSAPPLHQRTTQIVYVDGIEIEEHLWIDTMAKIIPRAERDLGCPQRELHLSLLAKERRVPIEVVATGCGQALRYFRPLFMDRHGGGRSGEWETDGMPTAALGPTNGQAAPATTDP